MIPFEAKVPVFKSIAEAIHCFPDIASMKLYSKADLYKTEIMLINLIEGTLYGLHTEDKFPVKGYPSFMELGISFIGVVPASKFSNGQTAVRLCNTQNLDPQADVMGITQPPVVPFEIDIIHRTIYDTDRICRNAAAMVLIDARKPPSRFFG